MNFRNVTKLQSALADYESILEDVDRTLFGNPHAKHEADEKSDALASRQYALKAMNFIDKKREKKCLNVFYNEGMLSDRDYIESIIESVGSIEKSCSKIAANIEKELIDFPAEEYEVHSELLTEDEEKRFQEQCRIIKQNIFGDFDPSKACFLLRKDDLINRQRTYAEEIRKLTERWMKVIACRVPKITITKKGGI